MHLTLSTHSITMDKFSSSFVKLLLNTLIVVNRSTHESLVFARKIKAVELINMVHIGQVFLKLVLTAQFLVNFLFILMKFNLQVILSKVFIMDDLIKLFMASSRHPLIHLDHQLCVHSGWLISWVSLNLVNLRDKKTLTLIGYLFHRHVYPARDLASVLMIRNHSLTRHTYSFVSILLWIHLLRPFTDDLF